MPELFSIITKNTTATGGVESTSKKQWRRQWQRQIQSASKIQCISNFIHIGYIIWEWYTQGQRQCVSKIQGTVQSGASSCTKNGGAHFSDVTGSIQDPIAVPCEVTEC